MKKFWQHLVIWQKAAIFLFIFLSVIFIMVFLESEGCLKRNFNISRLVKKEIIEIHTDKTTYKKNEPVVITFQNNINLEVFPHPLPPDTSIHKYFGENYGMGMIEKFEDNSWMPVEPLWRCGNACFHECIYKSSLDAFERRIFEWNQSIVICDKYNRSEKTQSAESGRYRISSYVWLKEKGDYKTIYSNEFIIDNNQKGLSIQTDKAQYQKGERITGKIQNSLSEKVVFYNISIVESIDMFLDISENRQQTEKRWVEVRYDIECPCNTKCDKVLVYLAPSASRGFSGDLKGSSCVDLSAGEYKIKINWRSEGEEGYSYSNEFIITDNNKEQQCEDDFDCEARFSHCDCKYHCVDKNVQYDDCERTCEGKALMPKCVCFENICVERETAIKSVSEIVEPERTDCKDEMDTDCWKTYRNDKHGYQISYNPNLYTINAFSPDLKADPTSDNILFFKIASLDSLEPMATVAINVYSNPQELSLENYLKKNYQKWLGTPSSYSDFFINEATIFNGLDARKFGTERDEYYIITNGSSVLTISIGDPELIKTFKLLR